MLPSIIDASILAKKTPNSEIKFGMRTKGWNQLRVDSQKKHRDVVSSQTFENTLGILLSSSTFTDLVSSTESPHGEREASKG